MSAHWQLATIVVALAVWCARPLHAQDFTSAAPGLARGPAQAIETGLAPADGAPAFEALATRWFALPELETRGIAAAAGWNALRVAAGVSQTGAFDFGWSAVGAALGFARPGAGASVRAVARRDRYIDPAAGGPGRDAGLPGAGVEAGAGAWLEAGTGLVLWVSAPQMWSAGEAPPQPRGLAIGANAELGDLAFWLGRESSETAGAEPPHGQHAAGAALRAGPLCAWIEAHDRPLRAGVGVSARVSAVSIAARVRSHPQLGETTTLALRLGGAGRAW